ncbi:LacI family transcriptional regulator [Thiospirochaeta perfilievii]|uniref:LacI family transcriptional regulator n=1 Tax=Thiospirochaeta perfilievii TaxID=252967 RepID=A0A5C1QCL2_9SPIO|nr:LacI family DNA-binding transcriptional regulator [Thiospirochaeta perfilievii]QEN04414.1 LacI family transcriptional regulator [Thiospirochaeta perfilievii]
MATQKDVAKLANVSFITVSRVINNMGNVKPETKKKVEAAIKELNYYPNSIAQGLNRNRVMTIAIEAPLPSSETVEANSYYTRLLSGIEKHCIKLGYDILLSSQRGKISDFDTLSPYYSRKADGIIILGSKPTEEQLKKITKDSIPCVIIGDRDPSYKINYVDTDNFTGMYSATKHLIENGHKKIAFIKGNILTQNVTERLKGYKAAMRKFNYPIKDEWIFEGDYTIASGRRCYKYLSTLEDKPTALVSSTDIMAFGVYEELHATGESVPDKMSIIGFDGHELCKYTKPPLTTIRQPLEDMGEEAAKMLINQIEDSNTTNKHLIFPVDLQYGGSVKNIS